MKQHLTSLFLLVFSCLAAVGVQAQAPVVYYSFTGNAKDGAALGNDASVSGATFTQDRFGWANSAMYFDGTQGAVTAPNLAQLNTGSTTISFWIKPASFPAQGEVYILSNGGWQERWKISLPNHGKPVFTTHAAGACCTDTDSGVALALNTWTHVAMVHDAAANKDKIYFNGVKVNEKTATGALDNTTHPLGIGYDPIDGTNYFNGSLDEVAIFNTALTDAQILLGYNLQNTAPTIANEKVASYSFDGSGVDATNFANHANLATASLTTDRFGFGNSALDINGASEVTAANSAQLNSDYTTISFWVKPNSFPATGEVFILSNGGWQERWKISLPDHGKPVFTTHANGACCTDMDSGTPLPLHQWTQVVVVHNGTKDIMYINGVQAAEKNSTGTLDDTTHPLGIGWNPIDGGGYFDGAIDELEIYNYALSATEIGALYTVQATFPGTVTDLVADYSLNGNGHDDSQFANHAELVPGTVGVANRHGWGSNAIEGAAIADNSVALNSDYTTISFWVKPYAFPASGEVFILSNGGWQERWKISLPNHGKPVFTTHANGVCCTDMDSGTPLAFNTWTHVAMVHDGTKNYIYFNGVQVGEKDALGPLDKTQHPLGIGFDPIDGAGFFDGALDDVQIYNDALSAAEIAALYAAQNATPTVGGDLVAYYPFSGNSLDVTDYHNNASPATLGKDRFGKANKAAAFNGATTEVTASNSPQLNSPNTTVSFWVNPNSYPANGEMFLLSLGGWQERWKISLPNHGKPVWTTKNATNVSDMDAGNGNELPIGTWTHVVMTHDGAKDHIYMNGVQVAEKVVVGALNSTTYPLGIGYNPIDGGSWFDGELDEVQIYNVALDAAEVAALYAAQSQAPSGGDETAPESPLNLTATVDFNNVTLDWLPSTDNVAVTAYNVYQDGDLVLTTDNTTGYFPDLTPLTDYVFAVTAVDDAGNESAPTSLQVTTGPDETPDVTAPSVPDNLQGSPSFNSILFTWDPSTDDTQVAGYITWVDGVYYDSLAANVTSVLVTGLDPQTAYSFEVAAYDLAGNESDKAELTVETTEPLDTGEPGLVAHYKFDGDANDATPYLNHGTIGGDPVFETANHPNGGGQDIKFNGQDSVLVPNAVQLLSDYTTISFWVRVDEINTADAESYILDFGHWDQRLKISLPQHRKPVFTTNGNNAQFSNFIVDMDSGDGNELVIGTWSYVTFVHDGTNDIIYKDGALANTKPANTKLNTTGRKLAMGGNPIEGGQYFHGALDNVKIYNRALTADEAALLFNTGSLTGTFEPTLVDAYIEQVFPNPTTATVTVKHQLPLGNSVQIRVFDAQGRQVDGLNLGQSDLATGQFSLNAANYATGVYSINFVLGGKNIGSVKFNKQ